MINEIQNLVLWFVKSKFKEISAWQQRDYDKHESLENRIHELDDRIDKLQVDLLEARHGKKE